MSHTFHGPLRRCPENPRYFTDDTGRAICLSGSHTWAVFQDLVPLDGEPSPGQLFDFEDWLAFSKRYGFNFLRLWSREAAYQRGRRGVELGQYLPSRYLEANPGRAPGELPKYDLDRLNPSYFERLRDRVIRAGEQGIYVSVMLFEAWTANPYMGAPFDGHPFNRLNNINGVDGDPEAPPIPAELNPDGDRTTFPGCETLTIHTLADPKILAYEKAYVKKVVETLNDLDNVLYEICNEALRRSKYWQYEMIRYIHELESGMPKQHPVWMTHLVQAQNEALFASPAEAVSPGVEAVDEDFCVDPPVLDGRKVVFADTDHLGGIWGTPQWVWKSFMRGHNPHLHGQLRDAGGRPGPVGGRRPGQSPLRPVAVRPAGQLAGPVREAMAQTLRFAAEMDMGRMLPTNSLSSTRYCLADADQEYLFYQPESGQFRLNLTGARGPFSVEWFSPATGEKVTGGSFPGGHPIDFTPPFAGEAVLHLKKL